MSIETIAKIILIVSVGIYAVHLFLVFRQIVRHRSDLTASSSEAEWLRFVEKERQMHKIVRGSFTFREGLPESPDDKIEKNDG